MSEKPPENPGPNITLLKWIVGILGVLIILFAVVIAVTIYKRMTAMETKEPMSSSGPVEFAGKGELAVFGDVRLPIPDDMDVISLTPSRERLFVTVGTEGAARLIIVVSLTDGTVLGSLNLEKDGIQ